VFDAIWRFLNEPMDGEVRVMLVLAYLGLGLYFLALLFDVEARLRCQCGWW